MHTGGSDGVGQGVSALVALQVIAVVPDNIYPSLHVNVAILPCFFHLLLLTAPFSGGLALSPVHVVGMQLPL